MRITAPVVAALLASTTLGSICAVVQQVERQGANDAPLRLASQLASTSESIGVGADVGAHVDLAKSLALFSNVFDSTGTAVSGTGYLDGRLATLPAG